MDNWCKRAVNETCKGELCLGESWVTGCGEGVQRQMVAVQSRAVEKRVEASSGRVVQR